MSSKPFFKKMIGIYAWQAKKIFIEIRGKKAKHSTVEQLSFAKLLRNAMLTD